MRAALVLSCLAVAPIAHADTFHDRDTFGLDVSTMWEPANRDAFGAGPVFRFEGFTSRLPDWLGAVTRAGLFADSADRVFSTLALGLLVRPGDAGLYGTLEGGATIGKDDMDEDAWRIRWTGAAGVGYRLGVWDIRATALVGGLFERNVWMFSIGRDFVQIDSTITRTSL
jgi:hypothetical protein